jgi:hypothetical protein
MAEELAVRDDERTGVERESKERDGKRGRQPARRAQTASRTTARNCGPYRAAFVGPMP